MHLTIGVFNMTDDSHEFFFPALGIHHLTIYHTLEALDFIFFCNRHSYSGHGIKSAALPSISLISCKIKVNWTKISTWNFE